jgi:hypothetical protein
MEEADREGGVKIANDAFVIGIHGLILINNHLPQRGLLPSRRWQ